MAFLNRKATPDSKSHIHHATAEDVRKAFVEYGEDLRWLALFLTGDERMAEACIVDACALAITENQVFEEWLERWARRSTIRSAIEMQKQRILQLAPTYERRPCVHEGHEPLDEESVELLVERPDLFFGKLDVFCRAVMVLRGIEAYSAHESALILGVRTVTVNAAYCVALQCLEAAKQELLGEASEAEGKTN